MRPDRSEGCPFLIQVKSVGSGKAGGSCCRSTGILTSLSSWRLTTKLSRKLGGPVMKIIHIIILDLELVALYIIISLYILKETLACCRLKLLPQSNVVPSSVDAQFRTVKRLPNVREGTSGLGSPVITKRGSEPEIRCMPKRSCKLQTVPL